MMALNLDQEGFLKELKDWNEDAAVILAANEGIVLSEAHWEIIILVRDYYAQFQISPVTRVLVKLVRKEFGDDKGSSIYLMKLFTGKPAKLISKIAGLPKPANCD
jgi:tRNA 2-thiouridine synthesizing protein E